MLLFLIFFWCSAVEGRCGGPKIFPYHSRFAAFNSRLGSTNSRFGLLQ